METGWFIKEALIETEREKMSERKRRETNRNREKNRESAMITEGVAIYV